jgi:ABC-type Fe3+/spermidine/putrescine transport system ATPase subunit
MLRIEHISLEFNRPILKSLCFQVKEGETLAIVGKSGAGKSSLLRILAGLLDATDGTVFFDDTKVKGPSEQLIPGHPYIELVSQDFRLESYTSAEENIRSAALHYSSVKRDRIARKMLQLFELNEVANTRVDKLSGGEQQRVALARALVKEPKVLLLDEPFSHLDAVLRSKLSRFLKNLQLKTGLTVVIVSHDGSEVLSFADRILHLRGGKIARIAEAEKVYFQPKGMEEARLFGSINSIRIDDKRYTFRPSEYFLPGDKNMPIDAISLNVSFRDRLFLGTHYEHYFTTESNDTIQLIHSKKLYDIDEIYLAKKA